MKPYRSTLRRPLMTCCFLLCLLVAFVCTPAKAQSDVAVHQPALYPATRPLVKRGFDHFYNSEYDKAIRDFETLARENPENPYATNFLITGVVFKELYRIGALDTESYAKDSFLDSKGKRPVDPAVRKRIQDLIEVAFRQEEAILKKNPNDIEGLYARGSTRGLRSTWMAMAEKAWMSGLRSALAARNDHERVLQLDPAMVDAKMTVGVHLYVIGSLNWAGKVAVALMGVTGNKQKGLDYLREVGKDGILTNVDAKIALALFLRREQKYTEALAVVKSMVDAYPKNFLGAVEYAHLLNAAGHGPEAISAYRAVLDNYKAGKYPTAQPQIAAFGLGVSLRGQRDFAAAAKAFEMAAGFEGNEMDLAPRANLAAGQMYDTINDRQAAVKKYEAVIASNSGEQADLARKYIKQPYRYH
jgi:tetratricopeptide (TPR) repeat protein